MMRRPRTPDEHNREFPPGCNPYPRRDSGKPGQNREDDDDDRKGERRGRPVG